MSQDEMQKKIEALVNNAEFAEKLSRCETCDEIAALFGTEGIAVSGEELETAMERISVQNENGEISEDDLEQVSGGCIVSGTAFLIWSIAYAVVIINAAVYLAKQNKNLAAQNKKKKINHNLYGKAEA
jgi:predicted ribosomally synthesized peptide with nif11-like leader